MVHLSQGHLKTTIAAESIHFLIPVAVDMACPRVLLQSVNLCSRVCRATAWTTSLATKVARPKTLPVPRRELSSTSAALQGRLYSKYHEWALAEEDKDTATIGISEHAQELLGDVVFIELPQVGTQLTKGETFGVVESVKAASDLLAMLDGEVSQVNDVLEETPELVNSDPLNAGWMMKMTINNPDQLNDLMTEEQYKVFVDESE